MKKKKAMLSIMIVSCILLIAYLVFFQKNHTDVFLEVQLNKAGTINIRLLEQRGFWWSTPGLKGDEYTVVELGLQKDDANQENHFFVPGHLDLSEVYVVFTGNRAEGEAYLDGNALTMQQSQCVNNLQTGEHVLSIGDNAVDFTILQGSKIPSMWIDTQTGMDYVHDSQNHLTAGNIRILSGQGEPEYTGEMESLKGRGNSSWYMRKKSYNIKFQGPTSLLGMTPGRNWVLVSGAMDPTALRNKIFLDMAEECGLNNALESELVDLYVDGEYYGCYVLTEKIAIGQGRLEIGDLEAQTQLLNDQPLELYERYRVGEGQQKGFLIPNNPEDISGGYLLEVETYLQRYREEPCGFITHNEYPVLIKEPAYATNGQVEYIANYVQEFEDALYSPGGYNALGKYYLDYIDLESFATRYLLDEISKNLDAGYSSYFFYKPQDVDKMYAGPIWDYDTSLGNNFGWGDSEVLQNPEGMYVNQDNWSEILWEQEDFREASKEIFRERFLPYLKELNEKGMDAYWDRVSDSVRMEAVCHGKEEPDAAYEEMKNFVEKRTEYLEREWGTP